MAPDFQHTAGEQRRSRTGEPRPGYFQESYWCHALEIPDDQDLEQFLVGTIARLKGHEAFLSRLIASGGRAELFIGFFLEHFNAGFSLTPELMQECATLGLQLDFDLYGSGNEPEPAA